MSGSIASYDQLVRQVEALKKENTHLRRELEDNSSHLSKLENETSDMKEVLKHLQGKLEQEARVMVSSGQTEVLDQLKGFIPLLSLFPLLARFPAGPGAGLASAQHWGWGPWSGGSVTALYPLPFSRCFLLSEIEKEEKEKLWYYMQLQSLSTRLDELPHVETVSPWSQGPARDLSHQGSLLCQAHLGAGRSQGLMGCGGLSPSSESPAP
uniref:APC regulator of WNT signaling pathway 2 n=1 Tax=Chelydra serpentina TaxID=8475 RepID=A0A8C3RXC5_CHESE